jgi:HK97 gp10 family phage protein
VAPVVKVTGLSNLTRTMRAAGRDLDDLKAANERVGLIVSSRARADAPRQSGKLASTVRGARATRKAVVRAGGAKAPYARYVEFGTRKMRARPYLRKAAVETRPQWLSEYEHEVDRIIRSIEAGEGSE